MSDASLRRSSTFGRSVYSLPKLHKQVKVTRRSMGSTPRAWRDDAHFREHVQLWSNRLEVKPSRIHVQKMKSKWGSSSARGRVTFNSDLVGLSPEFGEYVIVHELLHLQVPNHGKLFKALLKAHMPDWETRANGMVVCGHFQNSGRS
jgi:predicted metal-dependent hydrolase